MNKWLQWCNTCRISKDYSEYDH